MALEQVGLQAVFLTGEFQQGVRIYQQNITTVNNLAQQTARQSEQSSKAMADSWEKGFAKVAKQAAVAVASFLAVQKSAQFLKEATLLAARVETLGVSLAVVGKNAGYSKEQIAAFEEAVKAQGITTQAARQSLLMMAQAQIDWTHSADLARIAQDAAVIANVNSSEAFEQLTYIIQTGSIVMARRLGLQLSFEKAYQKMATTLGKTTEELTEQERVQARTNAVMEAGALIAGTYEAAMGTAGKQLASLDRHIEEITRTIGEIGLGAFATGIEELTRLLKDLRQWIEDNEEELEALGESVTMLVDAMVEFADLELPVESLTEFVETTSVLVDMLALGIEQVGIWKGTLEATAEVLKTVTPEVGYLTDAIWVLQRALVPTIQLHDDILPQLVEMKKADEDLFKTQQQLVKERLEQIKKEAAAREEAAADTAEVIEETTQDYKKAAEAMTDVFERIEDAQRDHQRKLADMADDHRVKQERDWAKYEQDVRKEMAKGRDQISKLEAKYQERREKAIAESNKQAVEEEKKLAGDIAKSQADFALRQRQASERSGLDRLQSERRYQYERSRLVAEGDTLALEEMDARYKLEQQEAKENEALQKKQAQETQDAIVEGMKAASREQAQALADALREQLDELKGQSDKEIEEQQQSNRDRLDEMAANFADQQRLADEDYQRSIEKADLNYQRQQEDLGRSLSKQEELQELGAENVQRLLDEYYGEGGTSERIMEGWHDREQSRIVVTEEMLRGLAGVSGAVATEVEESIARAERALAIRTRGVSGYGGVTMDAGGVVVGPQTVQVGAGVVEAFAPLGRMGGGSFDLSWSGGPIPVEGLERASPAYVNEFVMALAQSLTAKVRARRRG